MSTDLNGAIAEEILRMVKEANGIKDRDLTFAMRKFFNKDLTDQFLNDQVEALIKAKMIIAIEYSLDYTSVRNFLIPAKSSFIIRGVQEGTHRV